MLPDPENCIFNKRCCGHVGDPCPRKGTVRTKCYPWTNVGRMQVVRTSRKARLPSSKCGQAIQGHLSYQTAVSHPVREAEIAELTRDIIGGGIVVRTGTGGARRRILVEHVAHACREIELSVQEGGREGQLHVTVEGVVQPGARILPDMVDVTAGERRLDVGDAPADDTRSLELVSEPITPRDGD